ncbi:UNVERIFIED_ORG: Ca2+-binding RTX toxin-like protein [Pseudomonas lini]
MQVKIKKTGATALNTVIIITLGFIPTHSIAQPTTPHPQTEPRYINALPYTIEKSGHYKLATSLDTTTDGISVAADNVIIDLNGQSITGPLTTDTTSSGIVSFGHHHIEIRNGKIRGFQHGVYLSGYADKAQTSKDLGPGGHVIEHLSISQSSFRGIRTEGQNTVIRENKISNVGGDMTSDNAYAMGIETYGEKTLILNNQVEEVRGTGAADIGEGVGISLTRFGSGSIVKGNRITNNSLEIPTDSPGWTTRSRSSYGIWVGGDGISDVLVADNTIKNFQQGITFKRSESGALGGNNVTASFIPYYLPDNHKRTRVRDLGGNSSDEQNLLLKPGRATPGQVETVEPPISTYLSPLHRLMSPAFLPVSKTRVGQKTIEGKNAANMVDYWHPLYPGRAKHPIYVDLATGRAWNCCETDHLINIQGAQGTPYEDVLQGDDKTNLLAGGLGNDRIDGREGDDYLFGDEGDDELWGAKGNDFFDGGPGNDVMWGGPDVDTFVFWKRSGIDHDTIGDFSVSTTEQDIVDFAGAFHSYEEVMEATTQVDEDIIITLTTDDSITLKNVQKEDLRPASFKF